MAAGTVAAEETRVLEAEIATRERKGIERWSVLRRLLLAADFVAAGVGAAVGLLAVGLPLREAALFVALTAVSWPLLAFVSGLYAQEDLRSWASGVHETPRLMVTALLLSWPLFVAGKALGAVHPAIGALLAVAATVPLSGAARAGARTVVHRMDWLRQRTLIVGSGHVAGLIVEKLNAHREYGLEPVAAIDDEIHDVGGPALPTLGRLDQLEEILDTHPIDRVIIAFSRASHMELLSSLRACRDRNVAVDVVPRLFEFLEGTRSLDHIGGLPLLSIGKHKLSRSSRIAKRALDLSIAGAAVAILMPVFLAIAVAVRAESRGEILFRQLRVGRGGQAFKVLKFRSMYADADGRKHEFGHANDLEDGVMFKIHQDPRITRVGRFLRRYSLDELPQLLNVLRGDMSLVGPRPLITDESNALAEGWQARRFDLRPGITGPWQVTGRSNVPFQEMVRFDYHYVAGWSLARDIEILLLTVPAVLSGKGAY